MSRLRERPAMTRRPGPPEDPQAHERMRAILDGHKGRIEALTHRGAVMNSPTSAAGDVEVRDRNTPQRHGSGVEPQGLEAQATQPVATPFVQLPMGYDPKADPPALEWLSPVQHPNGEATQTSSGGAYTVFARRTPQGIAYIARHGLDALGASRESAQNAREMCERHYREACDGYTGALEAKEC